MKAEDRARCGDAAILSLRSDSDYLTHTQSGSAMRPADAIAANRLAFAGIILHPLTDPWCGFAHFEPIGAARYRTKHVA